MRLPIGAQAFWYHEKVLFKLVPHRKRSSGENKCYCESYDQDYGRSSQDSSLWLQGWGAVWWLLQAYSLKSQTKTVIPFMKIKKAFTLQVDMTQLVKLRSDLRAACLERGIKLSYMPFIVKVKTSFHFSLLVLNSGLLSCPAPLPHLEQHLGPTGWNDHLQSLPQYCPCHGHSYGLASPQHQGGAGPLCLWDCCWAEQTAAARRCRQTINIRPFWWNLLP